MTDTSLVNAEAKPADGQLGLARSGSLEIRVSASEEDVRAAQALRYRVFYEEGTAKALGDTAETGRDADAYDEVADHLMVIDHDRGRGPESVVGTYRLIRREAAEKAGGFYTESEYDISALLKFEGNLLELGRSCVDQAYRNRATMQLLWKGIAAYVFHHDIGLMFGCASLPGNDVDALAPQLSYLYHNHLAPEKVRPVALKGLYTDMNRMQPDAYDLKRALASLPPLIKGYLRLGGFVGDGAFIDPQFNTTDVCIVVQTDQVTDKYYKHYEREAKSS